MPHFEKGVTQQDIAAVDAAAQRMIETLDANPGYVTNVLAGIEAGRRRAEETLGDKPVLSLSDAMKLYRDKQISEEEFYAHLIAGLPSNQQKR